MAIPRAGGWLLLLTVLLDIGVANGTAQAATTTPSAIPRNEIGAKAGTNYQGDGLALSPTGSGVRVHCVFQRLDSEATPEGL